MKLKTRLKLAWFELAFISFVALAALTIDAIRPRAGAGLGGIVMSVVVTLIILAPLCFQSWKRLQQTRAQLAELGPDAAPSADLWTAPGTLGIIGMMVLVAAVAAALVPALLYA